MFYRAAKQRFSDAELLLKHGRTTGAVYLAGYGVECILKSLLLSSTPDSRQQQLVDRFRGQFGHDLKSLMQEFKRTTGVSASAEIGRTLLRVYTWSTKLRYSPGSLKPSLSEEFLRDAARIITWADERI